MRARRFVTLGALAAWLIALGLHAACIGAAGSGDDEFPEPVSTRVDRLFADWNAPELPGCALGVSRGGTPILTRAYGSADLEHGIANRADTIFEAGSVSKQFTAAAVLLLAQSGKLSLDDPVRKHIPELPDYGTPITVRHLIAHTSGLRDWGNLEAIAGWPRTTRVYTHAHVLEIVGRQRSLNYTPGTDFSYTNTGYNLAVVLVSRVTGKSFREYTREMLFEPLGMTRTSWRDDYTEVVRDRAIAYTVEDNSVRTNMPFENAHGNGGLLTTVGDLLKWNENAVHATVGGRAFVDLQHQKSRLTGGQEIPYAGGVYITTWKGMPEVSHSGGTAGYRAWLARYPNEQLSVAVLCNASNAPAWSLGRQVAELYLDTPAMQTRSRHAYTSAELGTIAGVYRNRRTHEALMVTVDDGQLRVGDFGRFVPVTADRFEMGSLRLDIEREPTGGIRGGHVWIGDEVMDFDRSEQARPSAADLRAYAGDYASDEAEVTLRVVVEEGALVIRRRPDSAIPLTPTYRDGFASSLGHIRFIRDRHGKTACLSIGRERIWDLRFARVRSLEGT